MKRTHMNTAQPGLPESRTAGFGRSATVRRRSQTDPKRNYADRFSRGSRGDGDLRRTPVDRRWELQVRKARLRVPPRNTSPDATDKLFVLSSCTDCEVPLLAASRQIQSIYRFLDSCRSSASGDGPKRTPSPSQNNALPRQGIVSHLNLV